MTASRKLVGTATRMTLIIWVVLFAAQPVITSALSSTDVESILNGTVYYDPSDSCSNADQTIGCMCSVTTSERLSNDENHKAVWNYLVNTKGLSENAAAGVMGNLEAESGINPWNMEPRGKNDPDDGGTIQREEASIPTEPDNSAVVSHFIANYRGYGIAQWTSAGRQQPFLTKAIQEGKSTGDIGYQIDYVWYEITISYKDLLAKLQEPGVSLNDASDEFVLRFERPASVNKPQRIRYDSDAEFEAALAAWPVNRQKSLEGRRLLSQKALNAYSGSTWNGSSATGSTCSSGVLINLTDTDTSDVSCATGSTVVKDSVVAYNHGLNNKVTLKTCQVGNFEVNSQISGSLITLLADATAAGLTMTSVDSFRSLEDQIAAYHKWCSIDGITPTPPPYPKETAEEYTRCPGAAPPGFSNHELGLAVDFGCNGGSIPQTYASAVNNVCFRWLETNASKYQFFEWGKGQSRNAPGYEGWHWSVDGN